MGQAVSAGNSTRASGGAGMWSYKWQGACFVKGKKIGGGWGRGGEGEG